MTFKATQRQGPYPYCPHCKDFHSPSRICDELIENYEYADSIELARSERSSARTLITTKIYRLTPDVDAFGIEYTAEVLVGVVTDDDHVGSIKAAWLWWNARNPGAGRYVAYMHLGEDRLLATHSVIVGDAS